MDNVPLYEYKALTGDDIRIIRLRPGDDSDDICVEIAHIPLKSALNSSEQALTPTSTIDKTLPSGWRSFRTPEGRLFYQDSSDEAGCCQYHHPFPSLVPHELVSTLEQELRIETLGFEFEDSNYFEALSYVWGDASTHHVVYVKDWHDSMITTKILVTPNLSSALRHLRKSRESRALWVDAICINQNDDTEKSRQILRMPDLYRSAWRIVVWLGEANSDSALAMKTLQYLGEQIEISRGSCTHRPPLAKEKDWLYHHIKLPYSPNQWEAVSSLLDRPWFNRLWVLQEIASANQKAVVQCGHDVVAFCLVRRALVGLNRRSQAPPAVLERIQTSQIISFGLESSSVTNLLLIARAHSCSVPHDKIFALLGFVGPKLREVVRPSYRNSCLQTYKEFFLAHTSSMDRLELLAHCCLNVKSVSPSWIADWRTGYDGTPTGALVTNLATGVSAANFEEALPNELHCTGIFHGVVTSTFSVPDARTLECISSWLHEFIERLSTSSTYPTGENVRFALEKALGVNGFRDRLPGTSVALTLDQWLQFLGMLLTRKTSELTNGFDIDGSLAQQCSHWQWGRFFKTEHGYLGWGPMGTAPGDEVCLLLGLFCPLVVRHSGSNRLKIVGGCYLHGLMDGEAILGQFPDHYTVQLHSTSGRFMPRYYNSRTGETTIEDPRLGTLDPRWRRFDRELNADDPEHADFFMNIYTGEEINYDPRLTKAALKKRGVPLQIIRFI